MKNLRSIELTFRGPDFHMVGDGFRVSQYFPSGKNLLTRFSPFILLDYNQPHYFEPSSIRKGVGAHPHRGFETVTFAYEGSVEHHDNKGNHGIIGSGDVQWMTAGSGILHKEYHETNFAKNGGILHMVQLWVNLPQKYKMTEPKYQAIKKSDMGIYQLNDNKGFISILAGEVKGVKGPAQTFSPMNVYNVYLDDQGSVELQEPSHYNTGLLVLKGSVKVNEDQVSEAGDFILFENIDGEILLESQSEDSQVLVLSGEPLDEPMALHGPFVMNTREEIVQAYDDYHAGKFGPLEF